MTGFDLLFDALASSSRPRRRAKVDLPLTLLALALGGLMGWLAANDEGSPERFLGMLLAPVLFTFAVGLVLARGFEETLRAGLAAGAAALAVACVLGVAGFLSSFPF